MREDKHEKNIETETPTANQVSRSLDGDVQDDKHEEAQHQKNWQHHG